MKGSSLLFMWHPSRRHPFSQFVYSAAAVHFAAGGMGQGGRKGSGSLAVGIQFVSSWDGGVADDISFVLKWAGRRSGGGRKGCDAILGDMFWWVTMAMFLPGDSTWDTHHTHTTVSETLLGIMVGARKREKTIIYFEPPSRECKRGEKLTVRRPRKPSPSRKHKTP